MPCNCKFCIRKTIKLFRGLFIVIAIGLVASGCSRSYGTFISDAATNPPRIERVQSPAIGTYELYSIEVGPEPRKALFFVTGSGCASLLYYMRDYFRGISGSWTIYAVQKEYVGRNDMGISCSQDFAKTYNYTEMKNRNSVALKEVIRRHGQVAGIVGVSEGGGIAAVLAKENPAVRRLAVIGSGGVSFRELGKMLDTQDGNSRFARAMAEVDTDPQSTTKRALGYPHRYWSSVLDIDPAPIYLSLNIPILMVFGAEDRNVPVQSAYSLQDRFRKAGKKNFRLMTIPDANHVLEVGSKRMRPQVMEMLGQFFLGA